MSESTDQRMTLHERAEQLWNSLEEGNGTCFEESDKLLIESALREVVEECAKVAEHEDVQFEARVNIAATIRRLKETP